MNKYSAFFRVIFTLAALVCLSSVCHGLEVSARVVTEAGKPLESVIVTDGSRSVLSAPDGFFSIETDADSLIISRLGYERIVLPVTGISRTIALKEKPVVLPVVRVIENFETAFSSGLDRTVLGTDSERAGLLPADLLIKESFFHSTDTSLTGEYRTLSLLGNLSRHTLIMLDNAPLNPNGEALDLSTLPLENIRRIEIVKGNASLHGGSSAIGGIVYLFTDNISSALPAKLSIKTELGSFRQLQNAISYEQQSPSLSYNVTLSRKTADNDFSYQPRPWWNMEGTLKRENNRKQQQGVALQVSASLRDVMLKYSLDSQQINRQLPGPVNFLDIYKNAYLTAGNLRHILNLSHGKGLLVNSLVLWQNADGTEYNNTRADNPVYLTNYRQSHSSAGMKAETEVKLGFLKAFAGFELSRQSYELKDLLYPQLSIGERSRRQSSVSLKTLAENDVFHLTNRFQAGMRLDKVTDFNTFISWRMEDVIKYEGLVTWQAGAAVGSGFSLPSFYDLYWKGDAQSLGNPDLKPETSLGGSVWTELSHAENALRVSYHSNEIEQLIQWRQTYLYGTVWKPVNIGKAKLDNWEFMLRGKPLNWLSCKSSLTLTSARDVNLDANLTYKPKVKWNTDVALLYKGITLSLEHAYTGRQWTTPDNLIDPIPELHLLGAACSYGFTFGEFKGYAYLRLNNLTDRQHEIYAYVPQPGFNWSSGISLSYEL